MIFTFFWFSENFFFFDWNLTRILTRVDRHPAARGSRGRPISSTDIWSNAEIESSSGATRTFRRIKFDVFARQFVVVVVVERIEDAARRVTQRLVEDRRPRMSSRRKAIRRPDRRSRLCRAVFQFVSLEIGQFLGIHDSTIWGITDSRKTQNGDFFFFFTISLLYTHIFELLPQKLLFRVVTIFHKSMETTVHSYIMNGGEKTNCQCFQLD